MGKGKEMITLREKKKKSVSKQQQKLMGLALAYKRGDVPEDEVSDTVRDLAKSMSTKELEKFAGTKHKGLPDKVNEAFSDSQIDKLKKEYEPLRTKKISLDHNKKLNSIIDKISHNKDALEKLYKADIPFVTQTAMVALMLKHNYKAADFNKLVESVEELEERYSGKQVKMAMGIASDPRYKQGNYSGAVKKIEKIAKGLSKHPSVASHLKKMNEDGHTDVDSSERMCKTVMEDAKEILEYLDDMEGEGSLPTWWTNKLATASKDMNSLRDYLVNPDDEKEDMKEYLEIGTDKIRTTYASQTPGQKVSEITATDKVLAVGALGALGLAAKKAKDRFDPVKVRDARKKRAEREAEKRQAQRDIDQMKREREQKKAAKDRLSRMKQRSKGPRRPAG